MLDVNNIRKDFPILSQKIYNKNLIYFDNGATTQKPKAVLDKIQEYYEAYNSNVHRGVHFLSQKATDAQEHARGTIQKFINAAEPAEIIFTKGTTDSINLLAYSFAKLQLQPGDEIILSRMEHHSNIIPWQQVAEQYGAQLKVVNFDADGVLDMQQYAQLLNSKTKIVAITWVSNTLGTINPVREIIHLAHQQNIPVMLDAAQAIQHTAIDVQELDVDFLVFSGHKIYGPTGIGILYGKRSWLDALPPYQTGGSMIKSVSFEKTTWADLPFKFEAGTPHIEGIIGLGVAIEYVSALGIQNIANYEHQLISYAIQELGTIDGVKVIGGTQPKAGAISIVVQDIHPFDIGELLDKFGIAVRTGHHCCQPIMEFFNIPGTLRVSFALYNTQEEVDILVQQLKAVLQMLKA